MKTEERFRALSHEKPFNTSVLVTIFSDKAKYDSGLYWT